MPANSKRNALPLVGFIIAFLGSILFSTKAIIVKKAFAQTHTDALTLLTLRMAFSLPFFIGVAIFASNKKDNVKLSTSHWGIIIMLGIFGYYLSSLFDFIGLQYVSAGLERLILFLYPSFVVLMNALFFKQPIKRIQVWALVLTYLGIGLAYFGEITIDTGNPNFYWGSFLVFLCSITYAGYIAGSGHIIPKIGASKFTAYALLASTAGVFLHSIFRGQYNALQQGNDLWWYGVALALIATVIPTFMLSSALKKIGANNVAIISSIGPVSTILQAHFFLGEPVFTEQIIGTVLVLAGILLLSIKPKKLPQA